MLTNLDFLEIGNYFPPKTEKKRLNEYRENLALWNGEHSLIYAETLKRLQNYLNRKEAYSQYEIIYNAHRLITLKTADLLSLDNIKISVVDEKKQEILNNILEKNDLNDILYSTAIDMSRYGTGLLFCYKKNNKIKVDVSQPLFWYKVVNKRNIRDILFHVICIKENIQENGDYNLYCEIHEKGKYTTKTLRVVDGKIVRTIEEEKVYQTGMPDFAIIEANNILSSDRNYGESDYIAIDSIVSEIIVRISQISKILDKFSAPNFSGPASAVKYNHKTEQRELSVELDGAKYIPVEKDDAKVEAITWDSNLDANFRQIELLLNMLYQMSEMSGTLLGDTSQNGNIPTSGVAYKRRMESTRQKIKRFRIALDKAIRKIIKNVSFGKISEWDLIIEWKDSFEDENEKIERLLAANGNKPIISQKRSIVLGNDMDEEEAEKEIEQIFKEEISMNPTIFPTIEEE